MDYVTALAERRLSERYRIIKKKEDFLEALEKEAADLAAERKRISQLFYEERVLNYEEFKARYIPVSTAWKNIRSCDIARLGYELSHLWDKLTDSLWTPS